MSSGEQHHVHPLWGIFARKDVLAGLFFIGVALLGLYISRDYPMGTALRMGPGYFPNVLSGLLILFGIYCLIQGLLKPEKIQGNWSVRALLQNSDVLKPFALSRFADLQPLGEKAAAAVSH